MNTTNTMTTMNKQAVGSTMRQPEFTFRQNGIGGGNDETVYVQ